MVEPLKRESIFLLGVVLFRSLLKRRRDIQVTCIIQPILMCEICPSFMDLTLVLSNMEIREGVSVKWNEREISEYSSLYLVFILKCWDSIECFSENFGPQCPRCPSGA